MVWVNQLWRGSLNCEPTDNSWDWSHWAVHVGNVWQIHGSLGTISPLLFSSSPRNLAVKISSSSVYKATEQMFETCYGDQFPSTNAIEVLEQRMKHYKHKMTVGGASDSEWGKA